MLVGPDSNVLMKPSIRESRREDKGQLRAGRGIRLEDV